MTRCKSTSEKAFSPRSLLSPTLTQMSHRIAQVVALVAWAKTRTTQIAARLTSSKARSKSMKSAQSLIARSLAMIGAPTYSKRRLSASKATCLKKTRRLKAWSAQIHSRIRRSLSITLLKERTYKRTIWAAMIRTMLNHRPVLHHLTARSDSLMMMRIASVNSKELTRPRNSLIRSAWKGSRA